MMTSEELQRVVVRDVVVSERRIEMRVVSSEVYLESQTLGYEGWVG